jgi:hypothetical protein
MSSNGTNGDPYASYRTISAELRAEARAHAGGYVYVIDNASGGYGAPDCAVPPQRIAGCWAVNQGGEIVGEFIPNPNFVPSPSHQQ